MLVVVFALGLLQAGAQNVTNEFNKAIRNDDLAALKRLLKSAGVSVRDMRGATPLMYTAAVGNRDSMKLVVEAGADVNAANDVGATPLM